ncbi:hypothetical protein AB0P36_21870 [Streptomyces flavidovirens]|uniref:hypothetical protein n=1 Tax=Streptomyces flavidovirens TaxID=67298 RepID=UPI003425E37A
MPTTTTLAPLADALDLLGSTSQRFRLTLRTYKVNAQGAVTEGSGKVVAMSDRDVNSPASDVRVSAVRLPTVPTW